MKKREEDSPFSMSFLDVMACGFAALVLILLVSDFSPSNIENESINSIERFENLKSKLFESKTSNEKLTEELSSQRTILKNKSINLEALEKKSINSKESLKIISAINKDIKNEQNNLNSSNNLKKTISEAGGIRIDSDYLILIIDTSGSMQSCGPWSHIVKEIKKLIDAFPQLKGIQVLKDNGDYIVSANPKWIPDTKLNREKILRGIARANQVSDSNPIPGLRRALTYLANENTDVGIFYIGDEFAATVTDNIDGAFREIQKMNTDLFGKKKAKISALGFITGESRVTDCSSILESNKVYLNFMRRLTELNDGSMVVIK